MVDTHPERNIVCDVEVRQCFWSEGVWNMHEDMHYWIKYKTYPIAGWQTYPQLDKSTIYDVVSSRNRWIIGSPSTIKSDGVLVGIPILVCVCLLLEKGTGKKHKSKKEVRSISPDSVTD